MTAATARARPMSWSDIPTLVGIERDLFGADAWSATTWWSELAARPRRDYVVVDDADSVVGYGGLDLAGEVADVMTLAVAPGAQARGLGRELLGLLVRRAREAGAAYLKNASSGAIETANPASIRYLVERAPEGVLVKASGGITTRAQVIDLLAAGAAKVGTSAGVAIIADASDDTTTSY